MEACDIGMSEDEGVFQFFAYKAFRLQHLFFGDCELGEVCFVKLSLIFHHRFVSISLYVSQNCGNSSVKL